MSAAHEIDLALAAIAGFRCTCDLSVNAPCRDCAIEAGLKAAQRAVAALQSIVDQAPCLDPGGGCFYPHFDGDGNEIGVECVDPLMVVQGMYHAAVEGLR